MAKRTLLDQMGQQRQQRVIAHVSNALALHLRTNLRTKMPHLRTENREAVKRKGKSG